MFPNDLLLSVGFTEIAEADAEWAVYEGTVISLCDIVSCPLGTIMSLFAAVVVEFCGGELGVTILCGNPGLGWGVGPRPAPKRRGDSEYSGGEREKERGGNA